MKGVPLGTRSLLFGAHCIPLHPLFVAWAWWKLFGFPRDYRLWCAFVMHDWGYWGKPNMDGPEGEEHVLWAARVLGNRFGSELTWLCLFHSRFFAKKYQMPFSKLCVADKLAIALTPWWLYLPMVWLSGELDEYMGTYMTRTVSGQDRISRGEAPPQSPREWYRRLQAYMRRWVEEHKDMKPDTWTNREAAPRSDGVRP